MAQAPVPLGGRAAVLFGGSGARRLGWSGGRPLWRLRRASPWVVGRPSSLAAQAGVALVARAAGPLFGSGVALLQQVDAHGEQERGPGAEHAETLPGGQELVGRGLVLGDELARDRWQVGVDLRAPAAPQQAR